ncbi:MAG: hypothetical protein IPL52_11365 [Flavobacteriales bacterium]|nr:hypothetical protein [Flavobacteriales bacterium]
MRYDEDLGYRWMRRMGLHGSAFDAASSVTTDAADNVYTTGYFITTAILCGDTLRAPIGASHIWLNKRDASGGCLWVEQIRCSEPLGMNQINYPMSLKVDTDGDLYLAGSFHGTIDFGVAQLISVGKQDIFLAKYDANGNCIWAIREGGSEGDGATSLSIDPNGGIVLVGSYAGNASIAGSALTSQGSSDGFLARYDVDGTPLWVGSIGGANWDNTNDVAMDAQGNVYITGAVHHISRFRSTYAERYGRRDLFVAKHDPNGRSGLGDRQLPIVDGSKRLPSWWVRAARCTSPANTVGT